ASFVVLGPQGQRVPAEVPLSGSFNVANALCAIALAAEGGLDVSEVARGIAQGPGVPGRLERVDAGQDFTVVVDYAHKPEAVEAAISAMRPLTSGQVILVIGAGGDRDTGKRPLTGEIGARLADVLIVTDDNPRSESPASIRAAVIDGAQQVPHHDRAEIIEVGDRRSAIEQAVALAEHGDIVVIAGKGHETGQQVGDVVHPFDDRVVARQSLDRLR
ncbi:MAG: UDP-N-acetylmuramoyl-L-alanyl-D-glutamate--2,6-diaminopimelate ligase, partial [Myxococcales bacterium]